MRLISTIIVVCFLLPACAKPKNSSRPQQKPAVGAPAKAPPRAAETTPDPPAASNSRKEASVKSQDAPTEPPKTKLPRRHTVPTEDGPALETVLTNVTSLAAASPEATGPKPASAKAKVAPKDVKAKVPPPKKARTKPLDQEVVKAVLQALNISQTLKGNRKGCKFVYKFVIKGAKDKDLGTVALCGPVGPNTLALFSDNSAWKEWQITVPDSAALAALLDKHLPRAKVN